MDDDLKYKIAVGLIPGIGDVIAKRLISYCGGAEAVFREKKPALMKIPGVGEALAEAVMAQDVLSKAEKETEFVRRYGVGCAYYSDDDYPHRLKACPDAPVIFYYKGNVDFNHPKIVSIVGTRQASNYGKDLCNRLVDELQRRQHHPVIVSGLAYGIDICAHRAALRNKLPTIAVLGHGLSQVYPSAHTATAHEMVKEGGALLTEFLSDSPIERNNFVKRNRLIAGLSDLTVVVESDLRGGALITADIANSYNRDVFAYPGRLTDTYSSGCNRLIKTNKASLLQSVEDIEYLMNWDAVSGKPQQPVQPELFPAVSPKEEAILKYLHERNGCAIDTLCTGLQMPVNEISALLLHLELAGYVHSLPGKVYKAARG
ncbi:MAG: DNA-processing protein DprA [Bacteroidales bacterium]|jgi:DNA processing protein|nr:DNA-processing protein DprA [Bacteroidales bacterium]